MICERGDDWENADLLERILGLPINEVLFREIEERVVMIIDVIYTDFEYTLAVVFLVRLDKLHPDVKMVKRLHAEVIFLSVIFNEAIEVWRKLIGREVIVQIVVKRFSCIYRSGQRDGVAGCENP